MSEEQPKPRRLAIRRDKPRLKRMDPGDSPEKLAERHEPAPRAGLVGLEDELRKKGVPL